MMESPHPPKKRKLAGKRKQTGSYNKKKKNRLIEIENKLVATSGERRRGKVMIGVGGPNCLNCYV